MRMCIRPSFVRTSVAWPVCAARPRTKGWERKELGQCDFANSFPRRDRNLTSTTACSMLFVVFYEPSLPHFQLFCSTRRLRENKPFNRFNSNDFERRTNWRDLSRLITSVLAFCLFPVEYLIPAKIFVLLVWSLSLGGNILPLVSATYTLQELEFQLVSISSFFADRMCLPTRNHIERVRLVRTGTVI